MSINNSILNSVGLTDKNILFLISDDGRFNDLTSIGHDHHLVLRYRATLNTIPERCPLCGFSLLNNVYLNGKDTADYQLPSTNGFQQILSVTKQRYQCRHCHKSLIAQSSDFMPNSKITGPLLYQIIDLVKRDVSEKEIAHILHLSTSKVNRLLNNAAESYRTNYERTLPSVVCVDEIRYAENKFSFEMIDGQTSDLIELFPERTGPEIKKNLSNYALSNRENVQFVITDMNANYQTPLRIMFPNAQLIIDRFHIIQLALKAVQNKVRALIYNAA